MLPSSQGRRALAPSGRVQAPQLGPQRRGVGHGWVLPSTLGFPDPVTSAWGPSFPNLKQKHGPGNFQCPAPLAC